MPPLHIRGPKWSNIFATNIKHKCKNDPYLKKLVNQQWRSVAECIMNMEQKINCNCSKKSGSLWWCWCPSFPILREGGRGEGGGGSISNPFISFQQSQLFAECNQPQFSAQQKYFSAKYSGNLGKNPAEILGLGYTCGPQAKFRLLSNESVPMQPGPKDHA